MKWLKRAFELILNPRAKLDHLASSADKTAAQGEGPDVTRYRIQAKDILLNPPLILGSLIVLGLFLLVLFGPVWAPQNPYTSGQHIKPHFDVETEKFIRPPLSPSAEFPFGTNRWGSDLLSLLLHGARNTLISAAFITLVRLVLGTVLGGFAGWNEGKAVDRVIMGLIGVTTSIPMLISSMILIYALDIRRGLPVFIIALSMIGWTEIAQYIRSEFLVLKKMPFIESAQALGSREYSIAVRHILPNILPQLLVIAFLEMGAVLMLLGELGFIGVFIGGGHKIAFFELMAPPQIFTLTEVPEWGAMLAEGYKWLRSKPFVIAPPAAAMFISILGFNFLGEGLRRLIEKRSIDTAFLLSKRMLLAVATLILGTVFILNNTGATPWLIKASESFNGDAAYQHIEVLSEMEGRSVTQQGGMEAADYIEGKFIEYGLEPGWRKNSYRYLVPARQVSPLEQPELNLLDNNGQVIQVYRHQLDFGFMIEGHGGSGEISNPLTFVGFTPGQSPDWQAFSGLDLNDRIVIIDEGNTPEDFAAEALLRGAKGVLWISGEGRDDVRSQTHWVEFEDDYLRPPGHPIFRIRPAAAAQILEGAGTTLDDLYSQHGEVDQSGEGWFAVELDVTVEMSLNLGPAQDVEIPCILGYLPGYDLSLGADLLVLFTTYDGLGTDPDGTVFPGANHNASSVGLMLEIAHLWDQETIDPRRSVMFVAWSGQLEIELTRDFFSKRSFFNHLITNSSIAKVFPEILIQLDYAGAGADSLLIHPESSPGLIDLLEESAQVTELPFESRIDTPDFSADIIAEDIQWTSLRWADAVLSPEDDILEEIEVDKIQSVGETLTLLLLKLVREADY
jgi:ABC-type dipeptide/oligopeptide/nickel transport system permease subunit